MNNMYQNTKQYIKVVLILGAILLYASPVLAQMPASTNYELQSYSFGSGTASSSSQNYSLFGIAGELAISSQSSQNYTLNGGLSYLIKANVPELLLTNPGSNYDRLNVVVDTNDNPSDVTYAIQVSTDSSFTTNIFYVKSDNTLGTALDNVSDFRTYTSWGSGTGVAITGLQTNTTYYARAKARNGSYTESGWGPIAASATVSPSLTFSIDSSTLTFNNLNSGNSYTDSSKTTVLATSTNAYNGYIVNARETAALTADGIGTIANYTSPNSNPTTWAGFGFGYTTNDNSLTGGTANRFTSGGPKYAGFTTSSPGDPVADHAGPVTSPISGEQFTISYRVSVNDTQKGGEYTTTVLYIVVPEY